jgi:hypothetical protein
MIRAATLSLTCAALVLNAPPATAQAINPQVDYAGFAELVVRLGPVREAHRLGWAEFAARARSGEAILLDARSADAYARGHLAGAVNLPFTDFTAQSLRAVLGEPGERPIYIYCNNNFSDDRDPVVTKAAPLALNIPTFVNLHGYGYGNVWELADTLRFAELGPDWVQGAALAN